MDFFQAKFFIDNRTKLRTLFTGTAPIVLTANGLIQKTNDLTLPFKQESNFWYLTGLDDPEVILVMDKAKEYLILPPKPKYSDAFEDNPEVLALKSGMETVLDNQEGWRRLSGRVKRSKHVAVLPAPPRYIEEYGFFTNPTKSQLNDRLKEINSDISFLDIRNHLTRLRSVKQPEEIAAINQAIAITAKTIKMITKNLPNYSYEYNVNSFISQEFSKQNCEPAFQSIVASGKNACTIHYDQYGSALKDNELLLVDIGAEVNHYSSDLARTLSHGTMSKRQKNVFDAVTDVQSYACSLLKPGVIPKDYEVRVADYMGEKLRELGLIKTINKESIRKYFPTMTSHFLGLDTHDIGDYNMPLQENMVMTVEPGIYIPEEGIGVRIEDDVIITKTGIENLSANLLSSFI